MPIIARDGIAGFSLEQIADRAGVTRNLLYHYFARGRPDLVSAVLQKAIDELTGAWVTDPALDLADRVQANYTQLAGHALRDDDPWRLLRMCRGAQDPELDEIVARADEIIIANISTNHLGRPEPPPLVHLTLKGFIAFFEAAMEQARLTAAPPAVVGQILSEILTAVIDAASRASGIAAISPPAN